MARPTESGAGWGSADSFRLLAEHAQDFIFRFRVQPDPGFDYVSPASLLILGYSPDELYADRRSLIFIRRGAALPRHARFF